MIKQAKWKPLELSLPRKIVKHWYISAGITDISATINNFKNTKVLILITFPLNSPIWPEQKKIDGLENDSRM